MMAVPYLLMAGFGTLAWRQHRRKLRLEERGGWVDLVSERSDAK